MKPEASSASHRAWVREAVRRIDADFQRSSDTHLIPVALPGFAGISLYLKDESSHPTGSLKHRLARSLFLHALCNGWLHERSTVVALPSSAGHAAPGAGNAAAAGAAAHAEGALPIVHVLIPSNFGAAPAGRPLARAWNYGWENVRDGLDGIARLRSEPADLVLSDVEMPGIDGFTLTRTIRRTRGWEQVPVVIMTSRGDEGDQRAGLEAGASAYLLKSDFDQTELVETVRRLVGR